MVADTRELEFEPMNPKFRQRVESSFAQQPVMEHIGATLRVVSPGTVEITMPYQSHLTQQHGFTHAGIVATVLDSACGYAAFSLMPAEASVLTVEYKINLLAPARGESLIATGRVIRPGRTITTCHGDVMAIESGQSTIVAAMQATVMAIFDRPEIQG